MSRKVVMLQRACVDCGKTFIGTPSSQRCPACRAVREQEYRRAHKEKKEQGTVRRFGSTDVCPICGKSYTVVGGLQKYCSADCRRKAKAFPMVKKTSVSGHVIPPLLRQGGPFEIVERYSGDGKVRFRARCKHCGRVIYRADSFFYEPTVKSCGCLRNAPRPGAREAVREGAAKIPHTCPVCGKAFTGGAHSKYCPDCRDDVRRTYSKNAYRRKAGWTEEEIALGHRIKK